MISPTASCLAALFTRHPPPIDPPEDALVGWKSTPLYACRQILARLAPFGPFEPRGRAGGQHTSPRFEARATQAALEKASRQATPIRWRLPGGSDELQRSARGESSPGESTRCGSVSLRPPGISSRTGVRFNSSIPRASPRVFICLGAQRPQDSSCLRRSGCGRPDRFAARCSEGCRDRSAGRRRRSGRP